LTYAEDFQEIEHCGGRVTIRIQTTEDGRQRHSSSIHFTGAGPAAWIGVYALLPRGDPIIDFRMGGIGQAWEPQPPQGCIPVFVGSDSEMKWGHKCHECGGYFRNGSHSALFSLTCPYCGLLAPAVKFLSDAQRSYIQHYVETFLDGLEAVVEPGQNVDLHIDMDAIVDMDENEDVPHFYRREQNQQTQFECDRCGEFNDIRGRYGYCAACGKRNNHQQLTGHFDSIRESLNNNECTAENAVLRSVSKFDAACRDLLASLCLRIPMKETRKSRFRRALFHNLNDDLLEDLKSGFDIDLFRSIENRRLYFRKMMERRHIFEHNDCVADARYIDRSGEQNIVEGQLVRETQENAHEFMGVLSKLTKNFDEDFHEIFPLTSWPVENAAGRRR
jgi:hypothetical protein